MQQKKPTLVLCLKEEFKQIRPQLWDPLVKKNFCLQNALFHVAVLQNNSEDNEKQGKHLRTTWVYSNIPTQQKNIEVITTMGQAGLVHSENLGSGRINP